MLDGSTIELQFTAGTSQASSTPPSCEEFPKDATAVVPDATYTIPSPKELLDEVNRSYAEQEKAEAWSKTAELIKTYSDEMVKRWNTEIDTLLVYGGIFSAILTAFNVQSYQLLKPDPTPDLTFAVLQQISTQLSSFSVKTPSVNSTKLVFANCDNSSAGAPHYAVWLNCLWFSGLICSLAAASIGIMVKQWIQEFLSGLSGTSREIARRRQFRLNNLSKWRVASIVALLPVLLQLSLVLFLSGLLVLLWQLNQVVAIVSSVLVGALVSFMIGSIILSALVIDCCYISPITFVIYPATEGIQYGLRRFRTFIIRAIDHLSHQRLSPHIFRRALRAVRGNIPESWRLLRPTRTRRGRGLAGIEGRREILDSDQIRTAYELTLDSKYLALTGTACLADLDYGAAASTIHHVAAIDQRHGLSDLVEILDPPMDFWAYGLLRLVVGEGEKCAFDPRVWVDRQYRVDSWVLWTSRRAEDVGRVTAILASLSRALSESESYSDSSKLSARIHRAVVSLNAGLLGDHIPPSWNRIRDAFVVVSSLPSLARQWIGAPEDVPMDALYQSTTEFLVNCAQLRDAPPNGMADICLWAQEHINELVRARQGGGIRNDMQPSFLRALRVLLSCAHGVQHQRST